MGAHDKETHRILPSVKAWDSMARTRSSYRRIGPCLGFEHFRYKRQEEETAASASRKV